MSPEAGSRVHVLGELRDGQPAQFSPAVQTLARIHKDLLGRLPERELDALVIDRSLTPVAKAVVDAARQIAEASQHKFLTTWLPKAMETGVIVVTADDRSEHAGINFDETGRVLYSYRDGVLQVDTDHPDIHQEAVGRIRSAVATNRITHAVVKDTIDGVSRLLWVGAVAGVAEEVFQKTRGMKPLAYAIASTTDNLAAMMAEARKLFLQGYSKREVIASMAMPVMIWATAMGVAFVVDQQFQEGHNTEAGVAYGGESAICVFPSIVAAVTTLRPGYEKLVKEGKVNDPVMAKLLGKDRRTAGEEVQRWLVGSQRALTHDLAYPHHAGLYIGATVGIILSAVTANIPVGEGRFLLQSPWVLVPLGVADSVGGALAGSLIDPIYEWDLRRNLKKINKE